MDVDELLGVNKHPLFLYRYLNLSFSYSTSSLPWRKNIGPANRRHYDALGSARVTSVKGGDDDPQLLVNAAEKPLAGSTLLQTIELFR